MGFLAYLSGLAVPVRYALATFAALALLVGGWLLDAKFERSGWYAWFESKIRPFRDSAAMSLGFLAGGTVLVAAARGNLLLSSVGFSAFGVSGPVWQAGQAIIGSLLLIGLFVNFAAAGLLFLEAALLAVAGVAALPQLYWAGIAVFLFCFSRGRYSLDWFLGKPMLSSPGQRKAAYLAMRITVGTALGATALWTIPQTEHPIARTLGLAAALAVVTGFVTRVSAALLLPFVYAAVFLAHVDPLVLLPVSAVLYVLFVFGDTYHKHDEGRAN